MFSASFLYPRKPKPVGWVHQHPAEGCPSCTEPAMVLRERPSPRVCESTQNPVKSPDTDDTAAGKLVAKWQLHIRAQNNKTVTRKNIYLIDTSTTSREPIKHVRCPPSGEGNDICWICSSRGLCNLGSFKVRNLIR